LSLGRGLFFDNSWRGHRGRNTFILFFVVIFTFGISPIPPGAARAQESEVRIAVKEIVRDRLARIYGGRDNIPRMASRIARGYPTLEPPKAGTGTIIRGAFLYLLPSDVQHKADGIWTRAARVMDGIIGAKEASASVAPTARRHLSPGPAHRGSSVGRPDTPVGQNTGGLTNGIGNARDKSVPPTSAAVFLEPQTSNPKPQTSFGSSALRALNDLLGTPEAKAWSEPLASLDRIHFYHTDHLGSTQIVTDANGDIYERIDYLPFGEIFNDDVAYQGSNPDYERDRFKFTGQMYDYLTNLYYYGARYYDPEIGRFTQADTIVPRPLDGQTFNRYTYCANNPFKYADPTGHSFMGFFSRIFGAIGAAIGAVIGGIIGGLTLGPAGLFMGAMLGSMMGGRIGSIAGAYLGYGMDVAGATIAGVAVQVIMIGSQLAAMCGVGIGVGGGGSEVVQTEAGVKQEANNDTDYLSSGEGDGFGTPFTVDEARTIIENHLNGHPLLKALLIRALFIGHLPDFVL